MKIVLASGSPRRKEIMKNAGYDFEVKTSSADEALPDNITPDEAVKYLAEIKGDAVEVDENTLVVSADTVVALDGKILGKPKDEKDAFSMLSLLSGRTHNVFTGVCVRLGDKKTVFCEKTEVKFYTLSEEEIKAYIATGEPSDKAGAYGIQGKGALLVEKINGDYLNVVGLPMARLERVLREYIKQ